MEAIFHLAEKLDSDRVQLNELTFLPAYTWQANRVPFWITDYGFHLGLQLAPLGIMPAPFMSSCAADQLVDLQPLEECIFQSFKESCRRAIRKAEEMGVSLVLIDDPEKAIKQYYQLAEKSAIRTGETLLPIQYYFNLYKALGSKKCSLLFAQYQTEIIGSLIFGIDKQVAGFMVNVSDPEHLNTRVNDFLHWAAIKLAKEKGCSIYRLGPYFPSVPSSWKISEVSKFKTKFSSYSVIMLQGSYFRYPKKYLSGGIELLKNTFDVVEV